MHIYILARAKADTFHIPLEGLQALGRAVSGDDCPVTLDIRAGGHPPEAAVHSAGKQLRQMGRHNSPDVIHAFGTTATAAALRNRPPGSAVVATFDETPSDHDMELGLARQVDAVVPVSQVDEAQWLALGVPTLSFSGVPALPIVDLPCAQLQPGGQRDVVTSSTGETLDALIEALPDWGGAKLRVLGRPTERRWQELLCRAAELNVAHLLQLRPMGRQAWTAAALFVGGREVARNGADCIAAAAHGVPAVAWAAGAHLDVVCPEVSGRLIEPDAGAVGVAEAVAPLLDDTIALRSFGESARVRACSLHEPANAGQRLRQLYSRLVEHTSQAGRCANRLPADRADLVVDHLPYAAQLARRYAGRGQSLDDLVQVANLGLVNAATRFDPDRGSEFYAFATPTILGELRRHFRDNSWAMHVPRSMQEASLQVQVISEDRAAHGLPPDAAEIADTLGLDSDEVRRAQQVHVEARTAHSLDMPVGDGSGEWVSDIIGSPDPMLDVVEQSGDVRKALQQLPDREREILLQRFYGERTQAEIADNVGMSQVQVSRLLSRTLAAIRAYLLYDEPLPNCSVASAA